MFSRLSIILLLLGLASSDGLRAIERIKQRTTTKSLDAVVSILMNMMNDFRTMESADTSAWEGYQKLARDTETERTEYIRNQDALMMSNTATLNAKRSDVQRLAGELTELAGSIREATGSLNELVNMRHQEHTQHASALGDLTTTIEAVNRAIQILEGHYAANAGALAEIKSRVQFAMTLTGSMNKKTPLSMIIMKNPDWLSVDGAKYDGAPEGQGGAGGVIGTLNELRSTLDANRQAAIETESSAVRDFEDQKGMQEATIKRLNDEVSNKETEKENAESAITGALATINQATENKADAQTTLQQFTEDLAGFTIEFQARERTRTSEMAATQAALDAMQSISSGSKSGVGFMQSGGLLQVATKPTLLKCAKCQQEQQKLIALAKSLKSSDLLQVAGELKQRTQTMVDPAAMDPVVKLLKDLIERLETEQNSESSHHDWCETEKTQSVAAKETREGTIRELTAAIERFTTTVSQLKSEVEFLQDETARVKSENQEAASNRDKAHTAFATANEQHTEVINALEQAMSSLSGQSFSMLQGKAKAKALLKKSTQKSSPFGSYNGGAGNAASATEMLEDLLARYAGARTQLRNDERNGLDAYNALKVTNAQFLSDTKATENAKIAERRGKVQQLANDKAELTTNFKELQELSQYLQDLRPSCDDIRSTFEERKRRREAEIAALKECLAVLSDPSMR